MKPEARRRSLLTAALMGASFLLACDGCQNPNGDTSAIDTSAYSPWICDVSQVVELPNSVGVGPVAASGNDESFVVLAALEGGFGEAQLALIRVGATLDLTGPPLVVQPASSGPLEPSAVVAVRNGVSAVGIQPGQRRAYFLHQRINGDVRQIDTPQLATLDRRISTSLIAPRRGSGVQVLSHRSGDGSVSLGRLAGEMLVTRTMTLPTLLVAPVAAADRVGGVALLTGERGDNGTTTVTLRTVGPEATAGPHVVVATLPANERLEALSVVGLGDSFHVTWRYRDADGRSRLAARRVDDTALTVSMIPDFAALSASASRELMTVLAVEGRVLTVFGDIMNERTEVWAQIASGDGQVEFQAPIFELPHRISAIALAQSSDRTAVFWRASDRAADDAPINAALVNCHPPVNAPDRGGEDD